MTRAQPIVFRRKVFYDTVQVLGCKVAGLSLLYTAVNTVGLHVCIIELLLLATTM